MAKSIDGKNSNGGGNSGKRLYCFRLVKNTFQYPTEVLQHVIFEYSASNNNKNVFVENVKKLSQHIAISGAIRYYAPTVAYAVRTLTATKFVVTSKPETEYEGGYD